MLSLDTIFLPAHNISLCVDDEKNLECKSNCGFLIKAKRDSASPGASKERDARRLPRNAVKEEMLQRQRPGRLRPDAADQR